jgi:hypothetical protein
MENNPYEYDQRAAWQMPQHQPYNTNTYPGAYINQPPGAAQAQRTQQAPKTQQTPGRRAQTPPPARMPKARAVALTRLLKKGLVVMSLATFASFSGLVAYHQLSSTSSQKTSTTTASSSTQNKNNTFFKQQGATNLGTSTVTATATAASSAATATSTSGSSSGPNTGSTSGPASGSHSS